MDFLLGACLVMLRCGAGHEAYRYACNARVDKSSLSSMDSDLEAFSHNPTHDSFAALPVQATAITKYVNQRFLSY